MNTPKYLFRLLVALVMVCVGLMLTACGEDSSSSTSFEGNTSGSTSGDVSGGTSGSTSGNTSGGTSGTTNYEGGSDTYGGGVSDSSSSPWLPPPDEQDPVFDPNADPNAPEEVPAVNPFVSVAHDPFSTFAADVDTASYEFYLGSIQYGNLPPRTTVRLEEFVNYFRYDYPAPAVNAEVPFEISLAAAQNPMNENTSLLRVGIQGESVDPRTQFEGKNIVFLVDTSGSMSSADKLPLVQEVLNETLTVLEPTDTVSIVSYAGDVAVRLVPTPVSQAPTIRAAVNGLLSGGGTWGEGGIQLAYQQAEAGFITGGLNHIILCTDGDFNIGVSNTNDLVKLIEEKRKTGITLTALGFGLSSGGDALMEAVSNAGNGVYSVVYDRDQAIQYVHNRMIATLVYIAKDMKIQLEFNPEFVRAFRLLGYENRAIADEDFRNDVVDAGEVGSGHQVTALYELVLVDAEVPTAANAPALIEGFPYEGEREVSADELVRVKVRYKHVQATETDPAMEVSVGLSPAQMMDATSELDADLGWAIAVAAFAEQLKGSPYAMPEHKEIIRGLVTPRVGSDRDRATFLQNLDRALSLIPTP